MTTTSTLSLLVQHQQVSSSVRPHGRHSGKMTTTRRRRAWYFVSSSSPRSLPLSLLFFYCCCCCCGFFLIRSTTVSAFTSVGSNKNPQLVIFAGPHKAASTSIESFFYEYASGHARFGPNGEKLDNDDRKKTFGLRYWLWPQIQGVIANETENWSTGDHDDNDNDDDDETEDGDGGGNQEEQPYKIFGHLVTEPDNDVLVNEILEGIRQAFASNGIEGVIIGSELFDQIGPYALPNPAPHDALKALRKVVEYLRLHARDVTVALNYRTPRIEQWAAMWAHATSTTSSSSTNSGDGSSSSSSVYSAEYHEWLCDRDLMEQHIQLLATQMNPLNAAAAYLQEGWKVRLIDMEGVAVEGRDISHVMACDVMTARCEDGAVVNHVDDNPHKNAILNAEFSALTMKQRNDTEQLFRSLDCAYQEELQGHDQQFEIIYNHSVWQDCDPAKSEVYQRLRNDPSVLYKALVSQIKCPKASNPIVNPADRIGMHEALTGETPALIKETNKQKNQRSAGSILTEFVLFVGIMVGAMGYQYHRMTQSTHRHHTLVPAGAHNIQSAADYEDEAEEGQFMDNANANAVDAEYGDADDADEDDFEDELPTGYKD